MKPNPPKLAPDNAWWVRGPFKNIAQQRLEPFKSEPYNAQYVFDRECEEDLIQWARCWDAVKDLATDHNPLVYTFTPNWTLKRQIVWAHMYLVSEDFDIESFQRSVGLMPCNLTEARSPELNCLEIQFWAKESPKEILWGDLRRLGSNISKKEFFSQQDFDLGRYRISGTPHKKGWCLVSGSSPKTSKELWEINNPHV